MSGEGRRGSRLGFSDDPRKVLGARLDRDSASASERLAQGDVRLAADEPDLAGRELPAQCCRRTRRRPKGGAPRYGSISTVLPTKAVQAASGGNWAISPRSAPTRFASTVLRRSSIFGSQFDRGGDALTRGEVAPHAGEDRRGHVLETHRPQVPAHVRSTVAPPGAVEPGLPESLPLGGVESNVSRQRWKTIRTTNVIERFNGEFRRRVKTQGLLPTEDSALILLFSLVASGQIKLRKLDGFEKMAPMLVTAARAGWAA